MSTRIVVHVMRGKRIESFHRGHAAVVDTAGRISHACGNPAHFTFARSAAKPLQAVSVVESGASSAYDLTREEIVLLCASHGGEPDHVRAVLSLLSKVGAAPAELLCGPHAPLNKEAAAALEEQGEKPASVHNNCSGKHAGMLALARWLGAPKASYSSPQHPVQQRMLQTISEMSEIPAKKIELATDGCGVPVFGMPLHGLALAFARLGTPDRLPEARARACKTITESIRQHPFYIAGSNRFDSRLAEVTGGRILGKMGAEGVFALSVLGESVGMAVKIEDGAERALYPVVTEMLIRLGLLVRNEIDALKPFHEPAVTNWQGEAVGVIVPYVHLPT